MHAGHMGCHLPVWGSCSRRCLFAHRLSEKLDLDKERVVRTPEQMAEEARELRRLF